mmetsp:Transcript_25488/g.47876  ORF Transcript_25488/g.47876 Transcript_25488/m.47876 type:complete len:211 (+) Transcript_25488:784-1416(+)
MTPQIPQNPWTGTAPTTSSIFIFSRKATPARYQKDPMRPMTKAPSGSTEEHPAVMETSPARIPLLAAPMSMTLSGDMRAVRAVVAKQQVAAEMVVVTMVWAATSEKSKSPLEERPASMRVEHPLNPYHPIQRMRVPRVWKITDCWGSLMPSSKRPIRGPMMMAPTRAATAPVKWTTPDPAKSVTPQPKRRSVERQAPPHPPFQPQWTTTG